MRSLALALALISTPAVAADDAKWSIGEEREISPSNYVTLIGVEGDWWLWRFEEPKSVTCVATKRSEGKATPLPNGDAQGMRVDAPYLAISGTKKYVGSRLLGTAQGSWSRYRKVGERFWTDEDVLSPKLSKLNGERVEVRVTSFANARLRIGAVVSEGVIDFKGYKAAQSRVEQCARVKVARR